MRAGASAKERSDTVSGARGAGRVRDSPYAPGSSQAAAAACSATEAAIEPASARTPLFVFAIPVGPRARVEGRTRRLLDLRAGDHYLVLLAADLHGCRHRRGQEAAARDNPGAVRGGNEAAAVQVGGCARIGKVDEYWRAIPRLLPQAPPPAVELGWLVLKNVVPPSVTVPPTSFSPRPKLIFQPKSLTPSVVVASNNCESLVVAGGVAPTTVRSLIM